MLASSFWERVWCVTVIAHSYTINDTFTLTHAKRLAAKVTADMHQSYRLYGRPLFLNIERYQEELIVMLHGCYIESYEFGFKTASDKRIISWLYTVNLSGDLEGGRAGGLYSSADVSSARFFNYMTQNRKWFALPIDERKRIEGTHSVERTTGTPPQDGNGYWENNRQYSAGGILISRKEFRPYGS